MVDGYIGKIKEFPASAEAVVQFKEVVDNVELKLRSSDAVTRDLNSGLKLWDAGKTGAQTVNVLGETALGTHALGRSYRRVDKGAILLLCLQRNRMFVFLCRCFSQFYNKRLRCLERCKQS